jgi:hypothetical protein
MVWHLFAKDDTDVGFHRLVCMEPVGLSAQVKVAVYGDPLTKLDDDQTYEVVTIVETLLECGEHDFEDGWLKLCKSDGEDIAFLEEKLRDAHADRVHEDRQRYEEFVRANALQKQLDVVRQAFAIIRGDQ